MRKRVDQTAESEYTPESRILFFCSSKEAFQALKTKRILNESLVDLFTDTDSAKEALESGKYSYVAVDRSFLDARTLEFMLWTHAHAFNIETLSFAQTSKAKVIMNVWEARADHLFHSSHRQMDNMTIPLNMIFSELSYISWISSMTARMMKVRRNLERSTMKTALVSGPSGVGKVSLAQIAHYRSPRKDAGFVFANCKRLEGKSHVKWTKDERNVFIRNINSMMREADGGTLYFHEIEHMDIEGQEILASVLRKGTYLTSGESKERLFRGVTIISTIYESSCRNDMVSKDIISLTKGNEIIVPSLSEYNEEILSLAKEFARTICLLKGIESKSFTKEAQDRLIKHPWSKNIRELFSVINQAVETSNRKKIGVDDLFFVEGNEVDTVDNERERKIKNALRETEGIVSRAAARLGMTRKTVHKWIRLYDIPKGYGKI